MNRTPETMLVPLDGSLLAEQAIPYVESLAHDGDDVILLQVLLEPQPIRGLLGNVDVPADEVLRLARDAAMKELERAATPLRERHPTLRLELVVEVGDAAERILYVARARAADVIVIASQGRGAIGRWTFGSVADRLARTAEAPVLIIRPQDAAVEIAPAAIRRLVVPLDGSDLAAQALPAAEKFAHHLNASIHVISVIDPAHLFLPPLDYGAAFSAELYEQLQTDALAAAQQVVADASARLLEAGISTTTEIHQGSAAVAIADACVPGDVIILTSHGRGGVLRWLLGSVAEKLVREGPVPVILLRSKDNKTT